MTLSARLLLALNRVFPRPIEYGGTSAEAYSQWEYETGRGMYERHFAARVALRGERVLDIGCGAGGKATFYAEQGADITALDVSEENVLQARRFALHRGVAETVSFVSGDGAALPFSDGRFDLAMATDTFEHFPQPEKTLDEISRVLRPGGRLLFYFTPHRSPLGSHLYDDVHLPWCHLLVREKVLFEAIEEIYRVEERSKGEGYRERARARVREKREYYRTDLNGMTVGRFLRILADRPQLDLEFFDRKPLKTRLLSPLTRLPVLNELFTTLAIGLVRKLA